MAKSPRLVKLTVVVGVLTVAALVVVRACFIDFYRIPQDGMYPGLPAGSLLLASRHAYGNASDVRRGDVIVFVREEGGRPYNYIWRVIGLPGETVVATGESLSINGAQAARQRVREAADVTVYREQVGEAAYEVAFGAAPEHAPPDVTTVVPPDHFFVMGDNRYGARDSRYFGPIPFDSILGKQVWP